MPLRGPLGRLVKGAAIATCLGLFAQLGPLESAAAPTGPFAVYEAPDGEAYFSLSISTDVQPEPTAGRNIVILFDTSASQTGMFRETALAAVEACLEGLRPEDRVQLAGVDLEVRPMTRTASEPGGSELKTAVAKLMSEPPLGSTDMMGALSTAAGMFDGEGSRVVIYIGDGVSNANVIDEERAAEVIGELRKNQISVSSYAIGPGRNTEFLAALANQTGGNLYVDEPMVLADDEEGVSVARATSANEQRGARVGRVLGDWARATVVWPQDSQTTGDIEAAYPTVLPPLRTDRDTIVVGKLASATGVASLSATVMVGGQKVQQQWSVSASDAQPGEVYISELVRRAEKDGGLALTTVGSAGLEETGRLLAGSVQGMTDLAERAVATGDLQGAAHIADAVLRRDPGNMQALTVQRAVLSGGRPENARPVAASNAASNAAERQAASEASQPSDDLTLIRTAQNQTIAPPPADGQIMADDFGAYPPPGVVADDEFLGGVERRGQLYSEMLTKEIRATIEDARDVMASNPDAAIQELKLALQNVQRSPELFANVRASLADQLQTAIREAARLSTVKDELDRASQAALAAARERDMLLDRLEMDRERKDQLMARFNALISEKHFKDAEDVADILVEQEPESVTPRVAKNWASFKRYEHLNRALRNARADAFLATLWQVELSHIPFPDSPPIVYPDPEVWEELTNRRKKYAAVDLQSQEGPEQKISEALNEPLPPDGLDFLDRPLEQVVEQLRTDYEIEVQIDEPALDTLGLTPDEPVTANIRNVSLRSALRQILKKLELTYIIEDEVLLITTEDEASTHLAVRVYPVADLVVPIQSVGMGGMGGMMGGMGGGMGGGMMGGMGGGMGGMGGGGMGGGMFSVPEPADAAPTAAGIQDDLVLKRSSHSEDRPETSASAPSDAAMDSADSTLQVDITAEPVPYWETAFANTTHDPAAVRNAVGELMKGGHYEHTIALIEAALRHGQPQPWMYESLGIAMQLAGRSQPEIERAIMSAADFSTSPDQLLLLGQYLTQINLDARAIQLFRQVAKLNPLRSEAYALGLRAAERADDIDALQWACLGILSQAWTKDQMPIEKRASQTANAIIERLDAEENEAEAKEFAAKLAEARQRDCVIRVSWTGVADVDLLVEEPGGGVCSRAEPRTPSGGVSLGDAYAVTGEESKNGFSETYVCPKGFSGDYRARLQLVWGEVTAGKVTVDVYKHYGSENVQHERQQIELGQDGAVVMFDLADGRREQAVEAVQFARAIERQEQVSQAVLAQQLDSLSDPRALPLRNDPRLRRRSPLFRSGAVGYQPVIQILPQGTNLTVSGVVSADRRYVRITALPSFSTIGNVSTFTFAGASVQGDDEGEDDGAGEDGGGGEAGSGVGDAAGN